MRKTKAIDILFFVFCLPLVFGQTQDDDAKKNKDVELFTNLSNHLNHVSQEQASHATKLDMVKQAVSTLSDQQKELLSNTQKIVELPQTIKHIATETASIAASSTLKAFETNLNNQGVTTSNHIKELAAQIKKLEKQNEETKQTCKKFEELNKKLDSLAKDVKDGNKLLNQIIEDEKKRMNETLSDKLRVWYHNAKNWSQDTFQVILRYLGDYWEVMKQYLEIAKKKCVEIGEYIYERGSTLLAEYREKLANLLKDFVSPQHTQILALSIIAFVGFVLFLIVFFILKYCCRVVCGCGRKSKSKKSHKNQKKTPRK